MVFWKKLFGKSKSQEPGADADNGSNHSSREKARSRIMSFVMKAALSAKAESEGKSQDEREKLARKWAMALNMELAAIRDKYQLSQSEAQAFADEAMLKTRLHNPPPARSKQEAAADASNVETVKQFLRTTGSGRSLLHKLQGAGFKIASNDATGLILAKGECRLSLGVYSDKISHVDVIEGSSPIVTLASEGKFQF